MDTIARLKIKNKTFEILVDCDKAIEFRKGKLKKDAIRDILSVETIFTDHKKGLRASISDLEKTFNTQDIYEIAEKILIQGELQLPQQYREKEREMKLKQVIDFLSKNCIDPRTNLPYTASSIETILKEVGAKIDENRDVVEQAMEIIKQIETKFPIKIATKRIKIIVPPEHTGKVYSFLQKFKREKEEWLNDGSFSCIIDLPAGMQIEFYEKLNNMTKGSVITEEVK